jgi:carbonic anhydrase
MLFQSLLVAAAFVPAALGCPDHSNFRRSKIQGRQADPTDGTNSTKNDWAYEASFNWGRVNPSYRLCQTGTQQSPIALSLGNGLALNHVPEFNYNGSIAGNWYR